jgi:hypothetical protein
LVAALDGTLALTEPHRIAVLVGQQLHLDVAGVDDGFFDIDFAVSERTLCLALGGFQRRAQFLPRVHQSHALATAAGRGFQHDGIANAFGDFFAFLSRSEASRRSWNKWNAGFFHLPPGAGFRAHQIHGVRSWSDKFHARIGAGLRELRIFRKEPVARMNRLRSRAFSDVEDFVYPQIRLGSGGGADGVSLVGFTDMERGAVYVGINGDGGDPHFAARAHNAHRDLSPIGDENLLEHAGIHAS